MGDETARSTDKRADVDSPWVPAPERGAACRLALARGLEEPVAAFLARPSKRFRARLVGCGARLGAYRAGGADLVNLAVACEAIELLHAGSLVIDDLQDGSANRRGAPAYHALHGAPLAVCGGNWLYFRALNLLSELRLPADDIVDVLKMFTAASEEAHEGQALDLSLRPDELSQADVVELASALIERKTGAIAALAIGLGVKLAGGSRHTVAAAQRFGRSFGLALQVLDDFGNLLAASDPEKSGEDLRRNRLSGIWMQAALATRGAVYDEFVAKTRELRGATQRDREQLAEWLDRQGVTTYARTTVRETLGESLRDLAFALQLPADHEALRELRELSEAMQHAYL